MKRNTQVLNLLAMAALLVTSACVTTRKPELAVTYPTPEPQSIAVRRPDSITLQGTWKGQEIGGDLDGPCYLIVTGQDFEFRGADTNEWYKGTFTLREDANPRQLIGVITACPAAEYVGKTSLSIYQIESNTLTLAAHEPGNPNFPPAFDASDTRRIRFKKQ